MTSFISASSINGGEIVRINGKAEEAKKTIIEGNPVVQLRRARQEESHFNWLGRRIREVEISRVLIYDDIDVNCLAWMIDNNIKVDLSRSFVSPDALDELHDMCDRFVGKNKKVESGSKITLPMLGGYSGMGRTSAAEAKCKQIGFEVILSYGYIE